MPDSFVVYGYVSNNGDGSYSIYWLDFELTEDVLDAMNSKSKDIDWHEMYSDGDGCCYREKLTFESKKAATAAGLEWETKEEFMDGL